MCEAKYSKSQFRDHRSKFGGGGQLLFTSKRTYTIQRTEIIPLFRDGATEKGKKRNTLHVYKLQRYSQSRRPHGSGHSMISPGTIPETPTSHECSCW